MTRPEAVEGRTTKLKLNLDNGDELSFYVTINSIDGKPFEMFVNVKNAVYWEHLTAITVMVSRMLQAGIPAQTIADDLKQIQSPHTAHWMTGGRVPSVYARIGMALEQAVPSCGDLIETSQLEAP